MIEIGEYKGKKIFVKGKWSLVHPRRHTLYVLAQPFDGVETLYYIAANLGNVLVGKSVLDASYIENIRQVVESRLSEQTRLEYYWFGVG